MDFTKLWEGFGKKAEKSHTTAEEVFKKKLASIVYNDDLINELAPIFAKLSTHEGFDKVFGLLEAKEQQIERLAGGEWSAKPPADDEKEIIPSKPEVKEETLTAEEILAQKYAK